MFYILLLNDIYSLSELQQSILINVSPIQWKHIDLLGHFYFNVLEGIKTVNFNLFEIGKRNRIKVAYHLRKIKLKAFLHRK